VSHDASAPRRRAVADFDPAQVEGWLTVAGSEPAGGPDAADATGEPETWLVAYTNPRREEEVRAAVERRALASYVPAMTVTRRRADVRRPVFPRYVFIGLRATQNPCQLAGTPGLFGLVRCDGTAVRIDPAVIRGLRADEDAGVFDFTEARERAREAAVAAEALRQRVAEIQPGRRVRMVGGTWAQFGGTVLAHMSGARVMVEVTLFARPMPVPIPLAYVRPVS